MKSINILESAGVIM